LDPLTRKAILGLAQLFVTLAVALFGPAWTFDYPFAWLFLAVFFASAGLITAYLAKHDPALLERRIRGGPSVETEPLQKTIQAAAALVFMSTFLVASLDRRFELSHVPPALAIAGDVAVALGFYTIFRVLRENSYTATSIAVAPGQTVVSTGPYAAVRHPMYAGALLMLAGAPLALGSWWALVLLVPMTTVIVARLLDEERMLTAHLPGYADYCRSVRYRLLPGVW
jgi:protein-S-isoprenylcysteine O-methyltransferase Ste14